MIPLVVVTAEEALNGRLCSACHVIDPGCAAMIVCQTCMCQYHQDRPDCAPDAPNSRLHGLPAPLPSHGATPRWPWACTECRRCRQCRVGDGLPRWCRWCGDCVCETCDDRKENKEGGLFRCSKCPPSCLNCHIKPIAGAEIYCRRCALDRHAGRTCPVCNIAYPAEEAEDDRLICEDSNDDEDNLGMIQCDECNIWCHISCVKDPADTDFDFSGKFLCPGCDDTETFQSTKAWIPSCSICKIDKPNLPLVPIAPLTPLSPTRWAHPICAQPRSLLQLTITPEPHRLSPDSLVIRYANLSIPVSSIISKQLSATSRSSLEWSFRFWSVHRKGMLEDYHVSVSVSAEFRVEGAWIVTPFPLLTCQEGSIEALATQLQGLFPPNSMPRVDLVKVIGFDLVVGLSRLVQSWNACQEVPLPPTSCVLPLQPLKPYSELPLQPWNPYHELPLQPPSRMLPLQSRNPYSELSLQSRNPYREASVETHQHLSIINHRTPESLANLSPLELCRLSLKRPLPRPIKAKPSAVDPIINTPKISLTISKKPRPIAAPIDCSRTRPYERRPKVVTPTTPATNHLPRHHLQLVGTTTATTTTSDSNGVASFKENQSNSTVELNLTKLPRLFPLLQPGGRYKSVTLATAYRSLLESSRHGLLVAKSGIAGYGLFTRRPYQPGELIIEYVGELVGQAVADRREAIYNGHPRLGPASCYLFRLVDDLIVDATWRGNAARFINHSCEPNCAARMFDLGNTGQKTPTNDDVRTSSKILIVALRQIGAGEELSYDYMLSSDDAIQGDSSRLPCYCGAKLCRKWM